jgi:hypothetical protein
LERNGDIVIQVSGVRVGIIKSKDAKFTDSEACLFRSHFEEGKRGSKQPLQEEFEGSKVNEFFRDWYCVEVTAASTFNRSRNKREFVVTQWRDEALNVFLTYLHYPDDSSVVDFKKRWDLD